MGVEVRSAVCFLTTSLPPTLQPDAHKTPCIWALFLSKKVACSCTMKTLLICVVQISSCLSVRSASSEHQSVGDFTDAAWTLATELQWHPCIMSKQKVTSPLVCEWMGCDHRVECCCLKCLCYWCSAPFALPLFVYVFLQLLSLVSQWLIIFSWASRNQWEFPVSLSCCWYTTFSAERT